MRFVDHVRDRLDADVHVVLADDGPLTQRLRGAGVSTEVIELDERTRSLGRERAVVELPRRLVSTFRYSLRLARRLRELDAVGRLTLRTYRPDDAADLLGEMDPQQRVQLLDAMEPDEAEPTGASERSTARHHTEEPSGPVGQFHRLKSGRPAGVARGP